MRTNVERRFEVLDTLEPTDLRSEIDRRMAEPAPRQIPGGPSPWRRVAVVAAALAVFAAAAAFAWEVFERVRREEPVATPDPWSWSPEGWTELPLPPEVRDEAAIVWTGEELVYWGGWPRGTSIDQARADGFAFDPETRTWRPLPAAPIAGGGANATRDERGGAKAVWTGSEVIFWDVQTGDEATSATLALDPTTGEWRRLDDSPHRPTCCGAWAWTGQELIVFGGGDRDAPTTAEGAALDPTTGAWRRIADAPIGMNLANAVWTGEEVVVVGSELNNRNAAETPTAIALGYRPETDSWRRLPDPPLSPQASEAVWFEGRVFAWDYGSDSAQYLPAEDRWQGLGRLPLDHGECYVDGVAIEGAVFAWNCGIPDAWYPGLGWTSVDGGPPARQREIDETYLGSHGRAIAAGSVAVVEQVDNMWVDNNLHIGSSEAPVHLWIWRPLTVPVSPSPEPTGSPTARQVPATVEATVDGTIEVGAARSVIYGGGSIWVAVSANDGSSGGTILRLNPDTGETLAQIPVATVPQWEVGGGGMAVGHGSLWVAGPSDNGGRVGGSVVRIDLGTNSVVDTITVPGGSADNVRVGARGVWVVHGGVLHDDGTVEDGRVLRIDPATGDVAAAIPVAGLLVGDVFPVEGALWVSTGKPEEGPAGPITRSGLVRIDPLEGRVVQTLEFGYFARFALEGSDIWISTADQLLRVDASTGEFVGEPISLENTGDLLVAGEGGMWFVKPADRAVLRRFNPATSEVDLSVDLGEGHTPIALATAPGSVWVVNYEHSITRVALR